MHKEVTVIGHRAYSFDPRKFHAGLATKIIRDHGLRPDLLRGLAVEIATHPSDVTREMLECVRYDEEWLEEDGTNLDRWYLIALAGAVAPAPHLNIPSYNTIKEGLPSLGWRLEDVRELLRETNLDLLPEIYGHEFFHQKFSTDLRQYGGWLDAADASSLLLKLGAVEEQFTLPAPALVDAVSYYAGFLGADPRTLIKPAYEKAREMLQAAIGREHALFLSLFD